MIDRELQDFRIFKSTYDDENEIVYLLSLFEDYNEKIIGTPDHSIGEYNYYSIITIYNDKRNTVFKKN